MIAVSANAALEPDAVNIMLISKPGKDKDR